MEALLTAYFGLLSKPEDGRNVFIRNIGEEQSSVYASLLVVA
jgi:hypothetical protein